MSKSPHHLFDASATKRFKKADGCLLSLCFKLDTEKLYQIWTKDLLKRLQTARRALKMSPEFSIVGLDSKLKIVFELVKMRQALDEIQMLAENRAAQLQREQKIKEKQ
jgi:hypothetical protein